MKFCRNCGKHYKDEMKFCADCGVELTQMSAEAGSSMDNVKANASQMADELSNKAKQAFSEENRQKAKEGLAQAAEKVKNFDVAQAAEKMKNLDVEQGKQAVEQGKKKFLSLDRRKQVAIVVVVVALLGYFANYFFSPEKQAERAANNLCEAMYSLTDDKIADWSDRQISNAAKAMAPESKRDDIIKRMETLREYVQDHPKAAKNADMAKVLGFDGFYEGCKASEVKISGSKKSATVDIVDKNGKKVDQFHLKKAGDGNWYPAQTVGPDD